MTEASKNGESREPEGEAGLPSRRPWQIAFVVQLILIIGIGTSAYLGLVHLVLPPIGGIDLLLHALLIGVLGAFLDGSLGFRPLISGGRFWSAIRLGPVLILTIAGIEELAQALSPNRSSTFSDFVADLVGLILFPWLAYRIELWRRKRALSKRSP